MSQDRIEEHLTTLFLDKQYWKGTLPRVIFWQDTDAEFSDNFDTINLTNVPELQKERLTQNNAWQLKQRLHHASEESCFLLYQAGETPSPREDWLLDARLYGQVFSARRSDMLQQELGFSHRHIQAFLKEHASFFNAQDRIKKLMDLRPPTNSEPEQLRLYMMCALIGLKTADSDLLIQHVLQQGPSEADNTVFQLLLKHFKAEDFFALCHSSLQLRHAPTALSQILIQIAVTHFAHQYKGALPKQWQHQKAESSLACFRLVDRWIHDERIKDTWFELADPVGQSLGLETLLSQSPPEDYLHCETFQQIDKALIIALRDRLVQPQDILPLTEFAEWIQQRTPLFENSRYAAIYACLYAATQLFISAQHYLKPLPKAENTAAFQFRHYQEVGYKTDQAYRKYWVHAMRLTEHVVLQSLHDRVEQQYNQILHWQTEHWDTLLKAYGSWPLADLPFQAEFFKEQVWKTAQKGERRTVVIISDAMRYEVAAELQERLKDHLPGQNQLSGMLGVLPSRTHFGMSALLPRTQEHLALDQDTRILLDEQRPENTESRNKLLQQAGIERGDKTLRAYRYDDVVGLKRDAGRSWAKDFQLAYVYHDQIDATGDKPANQDKVFAACEDTVDELFSFIKRLTAWNISQIIVTADHGFLYQNQSPDEHDKVDMPANVLFSKRRCALATEAVDTPGVLSLELTHYTHPFEQLYALIPRGHQHFRKSGGSTRYAHGGATLQETCVPVLNYSHVKSSVNKTRPKTRVRVLSTQQRITNNVFSLSLLQEDPVNAHYRGRQVQIFFKDEAGGVISNSKTLALNATSDHAPEREQRVSMTLTTAQNQGRVWLHLIDEEDQCDIIEPEAWQVSLSFSNEFGF